MSHGPSGQFPNRSAPRAPLMICRFKGRFAPRCLSSKETTGFLECCRLDSNVQSCGNGSADQQIHTRQALWWRDEVDLQNARG